MSSTNEPSNNSINVSTRRSQRELTSSSQKVEELEQEPDQSSNDDKDFEFDASKMQDFDEESIPSEEDVAEDGEIDSLVKESEMSIEDLMAKYGMKVPTADDIEFVQTSRYRKRRVPNRSESLSKKSKNNEPAIVTQQTPDLNEEMKAEPVTDDEIVAADNLPEDHFESDEEDEMDSDFNSGVSSASVSSSGGASEGDVEEEEENHTESNAVKFEENHASHHPHNTSRLWCRALAEEAPSYNSEDDEDYDPTADYERSWKGEIHIGADYQVEIPDSVPCHENADASSASGTWDMDDRVDRESGLMWSPFTIPEQQVERYERAYAEAANVHIPVDTTSDDEDALFLLVQSEFNSVEALRRLQVKTISPHEVGNYMTTWNESECIAFEKGFALYGKNFRQIQDTQLRHRSVGELVQFYYFWKKTARYDEFSKAYRKDKKKPLHPGITDFMDCLAQEQDLIAESLLSKATQNQLSERQAQIASSEGESSLSVQFPTKSEPSIKTEFLAPDLSLLQPQQQVCFVSPAILPNSVNAVECPAGAKSPKAPSSPSTNSVAPLIH